MRKCIIWGIGAEYDKYVNQIQYQVLLGEISIEAYVSRDKYCAVLDGKPVCLPEEVNYAQTDYIIVCNSVRYREIRNKAVELGAEEKKVLNVTIFDMPCFHFGRYAALLENPVSIIADDCWGAEAYHYLRLPFSSPFTLCFMMSEDYMNMLENLDYYLNQPLECLREADIEKGNCSIGLLGARNPVKLYFNHQVSFEQAEEDWRRRKARIDRERIFVKMTLLDEDMAERFAALPIQHKVGFYKNKSRWESICCLSEWRWNDDYMRRYFGYSYADYVRNSVNYSKTKPYDLLKILTGEPDYMRKQN